MKIYKNSGLHKTIHKYYLITIYLKEILMQDLFEGKVEKNVYLSLCGIMPA